MKKIIFTIMIISVMNSFPSITKIKNFLLKEYNIPINSEKLQIILNEIYDSKGTIINIEKYNIFDSMIFMMLNITFESILEKIVNDKINNVNDKINYVNDLSIGDLKIILGKKDREIEDLKEVVEELRTNYWNLKHNTNLL